MKVKAVLLVLLLVLCPSGLLGCRRNETSPKEPVALSQKASPDELVLNPDMLRQIGLETVPVQTRKSDSPITALAQVKADENRVFHINSFVSGRVIQDSVQLGSVIHAGQTLAVVQNLDVVKIQAESIHQRHQNEIDIRQAKIRLQLAEKNMAREKRLLAEGISPRKDYLLAESEMTLANSDLQGKQEHELHLKTEEAALLNAYGVMPNRGRSERIQTGSPVVAPRSGIIVKKTITQGDMVTPDMVMYEVADLSEVWLDLTIYAQDLKAVQVGAPVSFAADGLPGQVLRGTVNYIQPNAVEGNNTYLARVFLPNAKYLLKPGMLGQAKIEPVAKQEKPFVPEVAVQRFGREHFVFVQMPNGHFRKQVVQLGEKLADGYLVTEGLSPGLSVVTQGSFALKSQMLKSQYADEE